MNDINRKIRHIDCCRAKSENNKHEEHTVLCNALYMTTTHPSTPYIVRSTQRPPLPRLFRSSPRLVARLTSETISCVSEIFNALPAFRPTHAIQSRQHNHDSTATNISTRNDTPLSVTTTIDIAPHYTTHNTQTCFHRLGWQLPRHHKQHLDRQVFRKQSHDLGPFHHCDLPALPAKHCD